MKPRIRHPKVKPSAHPELAALTDGVGQFIEYWGFKSVQGRMWCWLFLSREPLSSRQLQQLLKISPALVTQSVQVLLGYRLILEAEKGPNGVLRFEANPDVADAIRSVLRSREAPLLGKVQAAASEAQRTKSRAAGIPFQLDTERLKKVADWILLARLLLASGIEMLESPDNPFEKPETLTELLRD